MTHAIAAEIPGSKSVILPGLRHMAMAENPVLFNSELLQFLQHAEQGGSYAG
jgi:pimeloyl-ACP methyl ester carboxylesterase